MLQELIRFGTHMISHPAGRRIHGMVVMHLTRGHRQAVACSITHIVVEDNDAAGTQLVTQKAFDLRIIDALDLVGIIEIADSGRRLYEGETVTIDRELRFATARVLD